MDKKPKMEEAKPLLVISENGDFSEMKASDSPKLVEAIYTALCAKRSSMPLVCIMAAVESFRRLQPEKYRAYSDSIFRGIKRGMEEAAKEHLPKQSPTE